MTTPPILRVFRGPTPDAPAYDDTSTDAPRAHPLLFAAAIGTLFYVVAIVPAAILTALDAANGLAPIPGVPDRLLRVVFFAFVLAHCGCGALWFARSSLPLSTKLLTATIGLAGLWLLLTVTMPHSADSLLSAQSWGLSIGLLATIIVVVTTLFQLVLHDQSATDRARFGIAHLLAVTTGIAMILGLARMIASRHGFTLAAVPSWHFFPQVQLAGCTTAALAIAIDISLRWPASWSVRSLVCGFAATTIAFAGPLIFQSTFATDPGVSVTALRWLFGCQSLFLLGTLVPLQLLTPTTHISK